MAGRNAESRFAINPTDIDIRRSRFSRGSSHKTSLDIGSVVPFYVDPVLPGDTFDITTSKVVRLQTLLTPVMDNIYLDTYWYFVPNRLVWDHWREFMGENRDSAWIPQVEYSEPQVTSPDGGWDIGTIADYMGIPTGVSNLSVSALPFRAYSLIMDEWFRDQNLLDPIVTPKGDSTVAGVNTGNYITDLAKGGKPFIAAKYHDYFTSCLPSPQKGPDVTIGVTSGGLLPVYAMETPHDWDDLPEDSDGNKIQMGFYPSAVLNTDGDWQSKYFGVGTTTGTTYDETQWDSNSNRSSVRLSTDVPGTGTGANYFGLVPSNLYAGNSGELTVATINQLRTAFQIQKMYEKDARGGTRYVEVLKSHFGVTSPDYRQQRPEYLGGNRIPITVNQVVQNSETSSTPQGTTTGQSLTVDVNKDFVKSFTEHGFVIGLMVARYDHTYQQGLERFWSRTKRFDYYWPVFANLGEMPVLNKEIYAQGTSEDDEVFGYQECWADYRYKPSRVSGEMRSAATTSLDVWHLADDYASLPSLSSSWIMEDKLNVDRVLAVTSSVSNQLFCDIYIKNRTTRPMPMYSIPGLIDHH